jgi:hypothetical protein
MEGHRKNDNVALRKAAAASGKNKFKYKRFIRRSRI